MNILLCAETASDLIRIAPIYRGLSATSIRPLLLYTGPEDEARPLFEFFEMEPAFNLNASRRRPTMGHQEASLVEQVDHVMERAPVDAALVYGGTMTAMAASMAAFYQRIPLAQIEAIRHPHDDQAVFPSEKHRELIRRLATWHFVPSSFTARQLQAEGCDEKQIYFVGSPMIEALQDATQRMPEHLASTRAFPANAMEKRFASLRMMLVSVRRRENRGAPSADIARAVRELAEANDDLCIYWPVEPTLLDEQAMKAAMSGVKTKVRRRIMLKAPATAPQRLWLMQHAWLILTDADDMEEQATALRKPALMLRAPSSETTPPEGRPVYVGTDAPTIISWVNELIQNEAAYDSLIGTPSPHSHTRAGEYIVHILQRKMADLTPRPALIPKIPTATPAPSKALPAAA